jgi:hypothetical protein
MAQLFNLLRGALTTQYARIHHLLRYRRNPALYVAVGLVIVLTGWRLLNGVPLDDILTEHYIESMLILMGGVITRLQVWAPESVEDLIAAREAYPAPEDTVVFDPTLITGEATDTTGDGQTPGAGDREV